VLGLGLGYHYQLSFIRLSDRVSVKVRELVKFKVMVNG
jgi:hypothetical protein